MVEEQEWQMSFSLQPHQHANGHLHFWIQLHPWPTQFRKDFVFLGLVLFTAAWPRQRVHQQLSATQALPSERSPVKHLVTRQGQTGLKWERATGSARWDAASWEKNRLFWVCWRIWLGKGRRKRNILQKSWGSKGWFFYWLKINTTLVVTQFTESCLAGILVAPK